MPSEAWRLDRKSKIMSKTETSHKKRSEKTPKEVANDFKKKKKSALSSKEKEHLDLINRRFVVPVRHTDLKSVYVPSEPLPAQPGSCCKDNTQWFICPARSSGALIRTHRVILMLSLRVSRSTALLEFIASQHWLPRRCIVSTGRTDCELCAPTPTRRSLPSALRHRS